MKLCVESGCVSASMLQRSLPVVYIVACRIIDWMENMGYVTDGADGKARKILITISDYEKIVNRDLGADGVLYVIDETERDEELDKKFAEYERYIREQTGQEQDGANVGSLSKDTTVNCIKQILQKKNMNNPSEDMPPRVFWENRDGFMQAVCDSLIKVISPDLSDGKCKAIKRAEKLLQEARGEKDALFVEVYERVIFELRSMSNYSYNKIREILA